MTYPDDWNRPQPPTADHDDVFASLHRWLDKREAKGRETYGGPLRTFNGRDAGRDLREELLDALVYAQQREEQWAALVEWARDAYLELLGSLTRSGRALAEELAEMLGPEPEAWR